MLRARFIATLLAAGVAPWARGTPQPLRFDYPNVHGLGEGAFGFRALRLALQKCGRPFELNLLAAPTNIPRSLRALERGDVHVMDLGTSTDFEQQFQPIHLPIDRGLNGWRLLVVRADALARFAAVDGLADLAALSAGQGATWPDTALLRAAGLRVVTADRLDLLFKLLQAGRFDYLPLGLNEAHGFLRQHQALAPDAVVEPHLALVYPFARLFFVRRGDEARRAAIAEGLERAFEDGSFQALFAADPATQGALAQARLAERRVLQIANPGLSAATHAIPARYFIRP
jgi:Bacterial extracellular solute-binding proteins, family 3